MSIYRLGLAFLAGVITGVAGTMAVGKWRKGTGEAPAKGKFPQQEPVDEELYAKDDFVKITKGQFTMGSLTGNDDERPPQPVTLSYDFLVLRTEITQPKYRLFAQVTGRDEPSLPDRFKGDKRPQVNITWNDADAYCRWMGERLKGQKWIEEALGTNDWEARLPYEFERERMARGEGGKQECSTRTGECTGDGIVYWDNSNQRTADVCSKAGNYVVWSGMEVCDLSGNAWEWCQDGKRDYLDQPVTDPKGPTDSKTRVLRGGSWFHILQVARAAYRDVGRHDFWGINIGGRCVLAPRTPGK